MEKKHPGHLFVDVYGIYIYTTSPKQKVLSFLNLPPVKLVGKWKLGST